MLRDRKLAQRILDASLGKFLQLLGYRAESSVVWVVRVNPRGTSEGLSYEGPLRDFISACRIKVRGWRSHESPAEVEPLLAFLPASSIVEAGSPRAYSCG